MRLNMISEALSKSLVEKIAKLLGLSLSELRGFIVTADVDNTRLPHGDWICKQFGEEFSGKNLDQQDELERTNALDRFAARIKELLEAFVSERITFDKLRLSKNINDYTIPSLRKAIHDAVSSKEKETDGVEKIGAAGDLAVYKVSDEIQLAEIGEGTSWCTRRTYPLGSRAGYYLQEHGWLYVVLKNNKPFMQICSNLSEPRDVRNDETALPPEILKIILPTAKFNSHAFFAHLERASSAKDKDLTLNLIDYALRQGPEVVFASYNHGDVAHYLAALAQTMNEEEFKKTVAFCLLSPPDLMATFAREVDSWLSDADPKLAQYATDKINKHLTDKVKALLAKVTATDHENAADLIYKGANWILTYIASVKISNWPELDEALAHAIGGDPQSKGIDVRNIGTARAIFTIADLFLDTVDVNNGQSAANPLPKFTAACVELIGKPNAFKSSFLSPFLRRTAAFGDSQEVTIRAALITEPLSPTLVNHFREMTERWPEWEEAVFKAWDAAGGEDETIAKTVSSLCIEYCRHVLKGARWPKFESWLMQNPWAEVAGLSFRASQSGLAASAYAIVTEMRPWPEMARVLADGIANKSKWQPTEAMVMGLLEVAYDGDQISSENRVGDLFTAEQLASFIEESMRPSARPAPDRARLKHFNYGNVDENFDDRLVFFDRTQGGKILDGFDLALEKKISTFQTRLARLATPARNLSDRRQQLILKTNVENLYKDQLSKCFYGFIEMLNLQEEQAAVVPNSAPRFKAFVERIIEAVPELEEFRERSAVYVNRYG